MQDNDVEEDYHALFIQRSLMQAGFEPKSARAGGAQLGCRRTAD
jgi:glutathionylspermidine amidase/synthetase